MNEQTNKLSKFVSLLEKHAPEDGIFPSAIENVGTFRMSNPHTKSPENYPPIILFVGQGSKYCYVGDQTYDYSAGNLLVMFLPMPVATEIVEASPEKPFIAGGIQIDLGRLADVLLRIERSDRTFSEPGASNPSGIFSMPLNDDLLDAAIRLFETLSNPRDAAVLGEMVIDEIYYRILCDERGGDLRTLLHKRGEIQRISRAVEYLHENMDKPVSVSYLADMVHMSKTSFYENFKAVMHISPLQYAKAIKLHKAQTLLQEGKNASEAGHMVGYNSPAQFSREYKRHFGYAPSFT